MKSRVIANTFFQVFNRGLVVLISLLTTALLTRYYGVEEYGNYVFITSFILIFVGLSDLGTTTIGVRESSTRKKDTALIFSSVLGLRIAISLLLLLFVDLAILFLPQFAQLKIPALIASTVILFLVARTTSQAILQTFFRMDLASVLEILAAVFFLLPLLFSRIWPLRISLSLLMIVWTLSALFSGIFGFWLIRPYLSLELKIDKKEMLKIVKEASPLGFYLLVYSVYDRGIDSFIIKTFLNSQAVAYYGLAYKIHGNLILGAAFLMNSLFPVLSFLKNNSLELKRIFKKTYTVLLLAGLLVCAVFFIFAPSVIYLVAGRDFSSSILVLRILLAATFFSYLNHLTGFLLVALGEQKTLLRFSLCALLLNLFLNIILIPHFSYFAAAGVTVLTELLILILTQSYLRSNFDLAYSGKTFFENIKLIFSEKLNYFETQEREI